VCVVDEAGTMNTESAYRACEEITRREAKNFGYGIRLLRVPERHALSSVYALARRIDDIGDGSAPPDQKLIELAQVRDRLHSISSETEDPVLVALAAATRRYQLPLAAFDELIDGCERDVRGTSYATFDDLVVYCRLVAGSIGRLSLAVFGTSDPKAVGLADDLGVALQLTNILRDVLEDRRNGRVYLPADDATALGCPPDLSGNDEALANLVAFECARVHEWFERGLQLLPLLDRRSRACVGAMAGIYHRLLVRIERDPMAVTGRRLSLPTAEKVWIAGRCIVGGQW
jgi:phytoene synthase